MKPAAASPAAPVPSSGPLARRRAVNLLFWTAWYLGLALVVVPTLWLVGGVIARAVPLFHFGVLTQTTSGNGGGLENALVGTALVTAGVLVVGGSISIAIGVHLSEFASR